MDVYQKSDLTLSRNTIVDSVFIDRPKQINQLNFYLNEAIKGHGKFVLINGEQGTGKSTFVENFININLDPNITFIKLKFSADDSFAPYSPFARLINDLENLSQNKELCNVPVNFNSVKTDSSISNDLNMEMLDNIHSNNSLIQQRIVTALFEYTQKHTLVVIIENVHLASPTAWKFFHYLSDKSREEKILFITTLRQDGREMFIDNKPVYSDILRRMNRDGFLQKITIERLSPSETKSFLHKVFKKADFSAEFLDMIFTISGGIPGQLLKYLKALYNSQNIFEVNGIWFNKDDINKDTLVQDILCSGDVQKIQQDFLQLPVEQKKLLKYALMLNGPFSYELLSVVTGIGKIATIKDLKKLIEKKYIIEVNSVSYEFKKSELMAALISSIPDDEQSQIHLEIAERIKESSLFSDEEKAYQLANHYYKSNCPHKAIEYLVEAGDYAIRKLAFIETSDFYKKALALLSKDGRSRNSNYARLYIQAAWLNRILGNYNETLEVCNKAHVLFGDNEHDRMANLIRLQKGFTYFRLYNWKMAKENLEVCINNIDTFEPFEKANVYFGIGNIHFELCEYTKAKSYYEKAQIFAGEIGASSLIALLYNHLGTVENITGNSMMAIALYSKSIPLYEKAGSNSGLAQVYHNIGMTYADEQNWEEANKFYGKSLGVSGMMGLTPLKSITFLNRALALTQLGRLQEAHEYNFKAIRLLELLNDELGIAEYHKIQGMLESKKSNWEKSMYNFELGLERFKIFENKLGYAETLFEKGLTEIRMENKEQALKSLKEAKKIFSEMEALKKLRYTEKIINGICEEEILA